MVVFMFRARIVYSGRFLKHATAVEVHHVLSGTPDWRAGALVPHPKSDFNNNQGLLVDE